MQSSENNIKTPGCYAVRYEGIVWASFRKEALLDYFDEIPNIQESAKYFDANPIFDESNPVADPSDRRELSSGENYIKYLVCDRSALEFQLSVASKQEGLSVVSSEVCNILVDQQEAIGLLGSLRADIDGLLAEDEWYQKNGERSQAAFQSACKAAGQEIGRC